MSTLGYNVQVEAKIGSKRIDVLAEKDNEIKLIEVVDTHRPKYTLETLSINPEQDSKTINVSKEDTIPYLLKLQRENSRLYMIMREISRRLIQTHLSVLDYILNTSSSELELMKIYGETFGYIGKILLDIVPLAPEEKEHTNNQISKILNKYSMSPKLT